MGDIEAIPGANVLVPVLGKIRASFAIAGPLSVAGKPQSSIKVYMRVIKEVLSEEKRDLFSHKKVKSLEEKVEETFKSDDIYDNARLLREGLEGIYDDVIDQQCGLNGVIFHPIDVKISNAIKLCRPLVKTGRYAESVKIYRKVALDLLSDSTLTDTAHCRLQSALDFSDACKVSAKANAQLRNSLDYVYDEIRLPELYLNLPTEFRDPGGEKIMLFGSADFGVGIDCDKSLLCDTIIGGESCVEFNPSNERHGLGVFKGFVKDGSNSGFVGVRFVPKDDYTFKERLRNCQGLVVSLRNQSKVKLRPKLQLFSEKGSRAFNWQAGFELLPEGEQIEAVLPMRHFWPSIFGHALPNNGTIQLEKVDSIGILISKIEENGSCNPNFENCQFSIAIEWIAALKDRNDA